jgi:hypothetical protein
MSPFNPQSAIGNLQFLCGLLASLILPIAAGGGEGRLADAVNVFHCSFGDDWDVDYDRWPDRWVRKTGLDYPHYVAIAIHNDDTASGKKCLRIDLDGAAAAVASPPIRVMPRFSYVFEAQLKNERLRHSTVVFTLDFYDKSGRVLQTKSSLPHAVTKGWQSVQLEPVEPDNPAIDRVVLGLRVDRAAKGDLHGRVSLAEVRLARLPRIGVSTNNSSNVYTDLNDVVVRCELSGIPERDPEIRFQLLDVMNKPLESHQHRLKCRQIVDAAEKTAKAAESATKAPAAYEGTTEWRPTIPDYGYYCIDVRMLSAESAKGSSGVERELASRKIHLAVVPPMAMPRRGEFGWTLPDGDRPLSFQELSRLLPQVGINWVKVPVWFDARDQRRGDDLIRFVELLGASNIEVVGMIDRPPPSYEAAAHTSREIPIAEIMSADSTAWASALEPVMTRLSLRVRWWQLGRDYDLSFVGFPKLDQHIEKVRTALFRFGQDVRLGMCWDWANSESSDKRTWDFQQLCSETPPTEPQFDELLDRPGDVSAPRWVLIEPPAHFHQSGVSEAETVATVTGWDVQFLAEAIENLRLFARASELVRRMVSAKVHGADAIIVSNPFDDDRGLMRSSGMPGELLLPWRTTAMLLGGAQYLGQMQLPAGSANRIFLRPDGQLVMVVWNTKPTQEVLYLGEDVRQYDVFGRTSALQLQDGEQTIHVSTTPTFVLGLHEAITRWRMAVEFETHQVPSIFKKPHPNALRFQNFFPQGVGGSVRVVVPHEEHAVDGASGAPEASGFTLDRWTIEPPLATFQLAPGQETRFPFEIELRNALYGSQPVRVEFKVESDVEYKFSVYRQLEVGTEDLTLDLECHVGKDGTLLIEQLMTNSAADMPDFRCYLSAKGRRPQRTQVYRLGPNLDRKVYRFPDGRDLMNKEMLLEIEELNGPRVLKYRFLPRDKPKPEVDPESAEKSSSSHITKSRGDNLETRHDQS